MNVLTYLAAFIFILGTAVVLHEFGHFIVAKLFKIRVETFSAGFGPRLVGKKWGDTDYRISAIPLGGYVKLGGDESNAALEGEGASDIPECERFNLGQSGNSTGCGCGLVMNILTAFSIPLRRPCFTEYRLRRRRSLITSSRRAPRRKPG
jgi:regulator of sigma E protease